MWKSHLIIALRVLWRSKLITFINIAGLAAAMAVAVLCLLFVEHETSFDTWHEKVDRIHLVYAERKNPQPGSPFNRSSMIHERVREELRSSVAGVRRSVFMRSGSGEISGGGERFSESVLATDPAFFDVFTFPLSAGDRATALDDPASVVLSSKTASKLFGAHVAHHEIIGRRIKLHFTLRDFSTSPPTMTPIESERVVTAVLGPEPGPTVLHLRTLVPASAAEELGLRGVHGLFVELEEGVSPAATEALLAPIAEQHMASNWLKTMPFEGAHFAQSIVTPAPQIGRGTIEHNYLLAGLAMLIVLVASINFVSLSMGRSATRTLEIGVRKSVGAGRHQLFRQFVAEAVLISLLAVLAGLPLAQTMLPLFNEVTGQSLVLEWQSPGIVIIAISLSLVVGVLAGLYPALVTSRIQPVRALTGSAAQPGRSRMGQGLLVMQFALSAVLVTVTLVMEHQLNYMQAKDLGFDGDRVAMAFGGGTLSELDIGRLESEIAKTAGLVEGVAGASPAPGFGGRNPIPLLFGQDTLMTKPFVVSQSYLSVMGTHVVAGHGFASEEGGNPTPNAILLNETAAKFFGDEGPVGKEVVLTDGGEIMSVVGVVEDFHFQDLRQSVGPAFITTRMPGSTGELTFFHILFRIDSKDLAGGLQELRLLWTRVLPDRELTDLRFLDESLASRYETERRVGLVMRWTSSIAIAISCMGLFGLAALAVSRRTREVGIRKALGASMASILRLISAEFTVIVVIANIVACPVAYTLTSRWLQPYAYRIDVGAAHFATAGAIVLVVAIGAVSAQTWRAARVNPVEALRNE